MKFLVLALLLLLITQNLSVYAQNSDNLKNSSKYAESKYSDSKIHPILKNWQKSENPDKFAQQNNLLHENDTVGVYIYLSSKEFQTSIAPEIKIMSSYDKTIFVLVTSEQLEEFSKLNFVEKITPPDLARTPPIPKPVSQTPIQEENQNDYILWIVIGGIVVGIVIALKYKATKSKQS
jgi:hypothetical protein